jgi:hypothetical protein
LAKIEEIAYLVSYIVPAIARAAVGKTAAPPTKTVVPTAADREPNPTADAIVPATVPTAVTPAVAAPATPVTVPAKIAPAAPAVNTVAAVKATIPTAIPATEAILPHKLLDFFLNLN